MNFQLQDVMNGMRKLLAIARSMMSNKLDDAFSDCLERVAQGERISDCAARYPEHAEELISLLSVASATQRAASSISYTQAVKMRGLNRMNQALMAGSYKRRRRLLFTFGSPVAKPVLIGFVAVFLIIVAAGGTTVAANNSVPGDALYWVKTTRESVELKIPRSDESKAQTHVRLAGTRGDEQRRLIERGDIGRAELLSARIRYHLNASSQLAGITIVVNPIEMPLRSYGVRSNSGASKLRAHVEQDRTRLRVRMYEVMSNIPPQDRVRVERMFRRFDIGYRVMIEAMSTGRPPSRGLFFRFDSRGPSNR